MTIYQELKGELRNFANRLGTQDKPMRRQNLNDFTDSLTKRNNNGLSEIKKEQVYNWLTLYCIKRHEK